MSKDKCNGTEQYQQCGTKIAGELLAEWYDVDAPMPVELRILPFQLRGDGIHLGPRREEVAAGLSRATTLRKRPICL